MFERLLNDGKIKKLDCKQVADFSLSDRDIRVSRENFESGNYDWAFSISYNAVLQAARTLMFVMGYRTHGCDHHKTVFEFLRHTNLNKEVVDYFDYIRKKRNLVIYRDALTISQAEVKECIERAEEFVQEIRTFVQEIRTGELNGE